MYRQERIEESSISAAMVQLFWSDVRVKHNCELTSQCDFSPGQEDYGCAVPCTVSVERASRGFDIVVIGI